MTIATLAAMLAPITDEALASTDPEVQKVSIVLAAVMGCIAGAGSVDRAALDALAICAGQICEHRRGLHDDTPDHT